jgi:hypothetical protein
MMLAGPSTSRRALLRHLWAMVQTRTEAAALVVSLQKTAVMQGVALLAVAARRRVPVTAVIVLIAVAAPQNGASWHGSLSRWYSQRCCRDDSGQRFAVIRP